MKLWHGRFAKSADKSTDEFNASISFDQRLFRQDIRGSIAHCRMLARQGIIPREDAEQIEAGLCGILSDAEAGRIAFDAGMEDIHMGIEGLLTERIGPAGKKLHTARSRNDQVALDLRLYLKDEISSINGSLKTLIGALLGMASENQDVAMPGYTHLQRAQPVTFAFHMLAYCQMFLRDIGRFKDCRSRMDQLPLGAGALSGTPYRTDREYLRAELGFAGICANAMDAVSDRDFALEFLSAASIAMMHLSRFCEELILWSSSEFSFIEMDDGFSTGSSIMPQKKNPDVAELIRGKTGRVYGDLAALLTIMKGLPLAYNKDMQEDKPPIFDAADTLKDCLRIFTEMVSSIKINAPNMENAARKGFLNATDAADYLVEKGVAFRDCHEIIGRIVLRCIEKGQGIEDLSLEELRQFSEHFGEDIYGRIDIRSCISAKKSEGSASFESVAKQIEAFEEILEGI
ncbi:MAG: argininosuccinate lyase [Clostridiales Family XIII bacterium]|jgi:argininosuccinate lyase|nr:argininosuccinate lyase [Clostridiales Family XIII bacterium]